MNITPKNKMVLIDAEKKKLSSIIEIPDSVSEDKPDMGLVLKVAKGVQGLQAGDKVVFMKHRANKVVLDKSKSTYLVEEEDVLATYD